MSFVDSISDLYSAPITAVMSVTSCYIGPRYNGTRLYPKLMITGSMMSLSHSGLKLWPFCLIVWQSITELPVLVVTVVGVLRALQEQAAHQGASVADGAAQLVAKALQHTLSTHPKDSLLLTDTERVMMDITCVMMDDLIILSYFNTLRPRQNCCSFADNIFKCILLKENVWISLKISLKFDP